MANGFTEKQNFSIVKMKTYINQQHDIISNVENSGIHNLMTKMRKKNCQ